MRGCPRRFAGIVLVGAVLAGFADAQSVGDAVVLGQTAGVPAMQLTTVPASGAPAPIVLATDRTLAGAAGLAAAPLNDGVVFTAREQVGSGRLLLLQFRRGVLATLALLGAPFHYVPDVLVDQSGDLVLLNQTTQAGTSGLLRIPFGGNVVSTVAAGIPFPVAAAEDLVSGRWIVSTGTGDVYSVGRDGRVTSVLGVLPFRQPIVANQHIDPHDSTLLIAGGTTLLRLDTRYFQATTVLAAGPSGPVFVGIDFDPVNGRAYRLDAAALLRFDPFTRAASTLARLSGLVPTDVTVWGGRMLTGCGDAVPGARYPIELSMPTESGRPYVAAAAFGALLGIQTPAGRIPLDPDPLFYLSLRTPGLFQDFTGTLGVSGRARLTVHLPAVAALRGVRFFVAAVSCDHTGIRCIAEPLGVTVE